MYDARELWCEIVRRWLLGPQPVGTRTDSSFPSIPQAEAAAETNQGGERRCVRTARERWRRGSVSLRCCN